MRDPKGRLQDILEAIEHIERYAAYGREEFERSELIQSWFIRHLQIIGEAARALPSEVKEKATSVPWLKIVGMRHILVHGYFEIDTEVVWNVVDRDLPELKREILNILRNLE
jgi:uncharacterized protein with HEPN domain